jgi:hypothetical protein
MSIDVVRTRPERPSTAGGRDDDRTETTGDAERPRRQRLVDVSDVSAATVAEYARDAVGTDRVHLERRPGRTFLVVD